MSAKMYYIKLKYLMTYDGPRWVVDKMKKSTRYNPGDMLDKNDVDVLCKSSAWDVEIVGAK
jgi:hypothetical protein